MSVCALSSCRSSAASFLSCLLSLACSDDTRVIRQLPEASQPAAAGGTTAPEALPAQPAPLYAIATVVSGPDESNMYLRVLDSLEPQAELDLSLAREFPGWSDVKASGGKLFVSSGEEPIVTRFGVNAELELVEEGRISFAAYTQSSPMYVQTFASETKAYLSLSANEYVIWNPTTLTITGTLTGEELAPVGGAEATPAQDRGMIVRGQRLYHSVSWFDAENLEMPATSRIVVIDTEADDIVGNLDAPCPLLDPGTLDEDGNIYFSNWVFSPPATLLNAQARACAVRIPAGGDTLDPSFRLEFAASTGGREAAALAYVGGGQALLSVFHEDNQAFDPRVDNPFEWIQADNWRFATVDLETREAREVAALGWHSGGYFAVRIQGASYLLVPGDGNESTVLYRLSPGGGATRILGTSGWSTRLFQLR